jgi:hypothetical protein
VIKGANCPAAYHGPDVGYWRIDCVTPYRSDNEAKNGVKWARDGLGFERDHIGDLPRVMSVRLLRTWGLFQPRRMVHFAEGQKLTAARAGLITYYVLLALSGCGIVVLRRRREPLLILVAPAIAVSLVSVLYYGLPRFRAPAELSLIVLSAVALVALAERVAAHGLRAPSTHTSSG